MRKFWSNFGVGIGILLLSACGSRVVPAPVTYSDQLNRINPTQYTVKAGDTLYSIAWNFGLDYRDLAARNNIAEPYPINTGQVLWLNADGYRFQQSAQAQSAPDAMPAPKLAKAPAPAPVSDLASAGRLSPAVPAVSTKPAQSLAAKSSLPVRAAVKARVASKRTTPKPAVANNVRVLRWYRPVKAQVSRSYGVKGNKGIDFAVGYGDPVYSAAAGTVVYSGSGLPGYGKLVIIKHNSDFLSAYAHNSQLLVNEGQWVKPHQAIARAGNDGIRGATLHFQMRRDGKPVNPLKYLPKA